MYSDEVKINASILREQNMSNSTISIVLSKKYNTQYSVSDIVMMLEEFDSENSAIRGKNDRVDYLSESDPKVMIALKLVSHWKMICGCIVLAFLSVVVCLAVFCSVKAAIITAASVIGVVVTLIIIFAILIKTGVLMNWLDYLNDKKLNKTRGEEER